MELAIIAARSLNGVIGKGSDIPWQVKGEQAVFKRITMGGTLVMGRKTFESIGRPLPGRTTIIVTRNTAYSQPGCTTCASLVSAQEVAQTLGKDTFIAGGGEIYAQALRFVSTVHLTTIQATVEGDIYFPDFPTPDFTLVEEVHHGSNIDFIYQRYQRT
jgi:dihydrofolate reductase